MLQAGIEMTVGYLTPRLSSLSALVMEFFYVCVFYIYVIESPGVLSS